ncbi:glycoside hydrolase family 75 protein [Longispora sp. K20-0274]|uniref:glycoside hydrolase family 75 protein n=1 Tax=Longispora sp. K20-0274 TaxID=3088255 RepID=UPI00399AC8B7
MSVRKFLTVGLGLALAAGGVFAVAGSAHAAEAAAPTARQILARAGQNCRVVSDGKLATDDGRAGTVNVCKAGSGLVFRADLDIDCDGVATRECAADRTRGSDTAVHTSKGRPFNPVTSHYYVLPIPTAKFSYARQGIRPGSVAAIIYHDKLVYAVFADVGPRNVLGEASYSVAKALGINANPNTGGVDSGVTYVVFPGQVPGPVESNAAMDAKGRSAAAAFLRS